MRRPSKRIIISLSIVTVIAMIVVAVINRENFHSVVDGTYYRSAQLNKHALERVIQDKKIKSIINLRGIWKSNPWYQDEANVAHNKHIRLYSIRLPAQGLPPMDGFKKMVHAIVTATPPVLVHCKSGSDRTGLASAIILLIHQNAPVDEAWQQIHWTYGAISDTSTGKLVLPIYQQWLKDNKLRSNRDNFLYWVNHLQRWDKPVIPLPTRIVPIKKPSDTSPLPKAA